MDKNELNSYEKMGKIALTEAERERFLELFGRLCEKYGEIMAFDTGATEPLVSVAERSDIMRVDTAVKYPGRESLLAASPNPGADYFRVPRTLE